MVYRLILTTTFLVSLFHLGHAQPRVIDEVVAIVGENYVLRSDIDKEFETLKEQVGAEFVHDSMKVDILDQLIFNKLLLYKAQLDSVVISDEQVDGKMEERMQYILGHFGGDEKALEQYLGQTVNEFKAKTRPKMKEQMLIQEMKNQIIREVKVTPSEVRKYFNNIPKDSLPPIPAEVEVAQILIKPKVSDFAREYARMEAEGIRERILKGEDFCFLSKLYSDDPSSSGKCGELGFFKRGRMVPEFEATAFKLGKDSISEVIESQYGFHILQLLERRGESVNVRHILISPDLVRDDMQKAYRRLDSLRDAIVNKQIGFFEAAKQYSDDEYTSANGGRLSDFSTGSTKLAIDALDKEVFLTIKDMKSGEISIVRTLRNQEGKELYAIYYLISETEPHLPSLETDYLKIQAAALEQKKNQALDDWTAKSKKLYYIKINPRYASEPELAHWIQN